MLYDVILERWFKNGSQAYSVDNLGDVEIVLLSFIANKSSPNAHIPWDKYEWILLKRNMLEKDIIFGYLFKVRRWSCTSRI